MGNVDLAFALKQRGGADQLLALRPRHGRKVPRVAAHIVFLHAHLNVGNRHRAQQVGREPRHVQQAVRLRGRLQRVANQRNGRAGVLLLRVPGAARKLAGAEHIGAQRGKGRGGQCDGIGHANYSCFDSCSRNRYEG